MKRFLLIAGLIITAKASMAQWAMNVNYSLWVPTGKYNSDLKLGFAGANLQFNYSFDDNLVGTFGTGYSLIGYDNIRIDGVDRKASSATLQIIPVTVGADIYFSTEKVRPYLDFDFGVAFVKASGDNLPESKMMVNPYLSPGLGIEYQLSDGLKLNGVLKQHTLIYRFDETVKYNEVFSAVGLNLGFTYKF